MNTYIKLTVFWLGFLLAAYNADAYQYKQLRSLNAAASVTNGASFDGSTREKMPPPGGGIQWNIIINTSASVTLTYQIQAQMIDGTWVSITSPYITGTNPSVVLSGAYPQTTHAFNFIGPFLDMRVAIVAYTSGTLTADMLVTY